MSLVVLALFGGVVALDGVSLVQSMVSRPLAAGIVAGFILGDPVLGAQMGALLELFLLVAVPAGGGRMPEGGMATLVAVAAAVSAPGPAGMALGVSAALVWGEVAGWTQSRLRIWNGTHVPVPGDTPVNAAAVERSLRLGVLADGTRGVVVTGVGVGLAWTISPLLATAWPLASRPTGALLLLGALVSVGVVVRGRGLERRASILFLGGILTGILAGVRFP